MKFPPPSTISTLLLSLALLFTPSTPSALAAAATWTVGQPVDTTSGTIKGHAAPLDASVSEYLGIPFAAAPVGPLRFLPPQPVARAEKAIAADRFGPDCPQAGMGAVPKAASGSAAGASVTNSFSGSGRFAEDCLRLNVWTRPQTGEARKAVLVWIYGGGFTSGSAASPSTSGVRFAAEQDVVLVSINYRLNIMGFPSAPGLADLNLGMIDQRRATEWVRDNIAAFGGDPKRITLFGESSGGRGVDMYAFAWAKEKDAIVNGFITESGDAPLTTGYKQRLEDWYELSTRLGCGGAEQGNATVACVRGKSLDAVYGAAGSNGGKRADITTRFTPVVDEKIYFGDFDKRRAAGTFIKRPILAGNNDNEAGLFSYLSARRGQPSSAAANRQTNAGYTCGAAVAAEGRIAKQIPAWRYRYMAQWPNQRISADAGAFHGSEIQSVFGFPEGGGRAGGSGAATAAQKSVSGMMNKAWAAFAKDPEGGLTRLGLPVYDPKGKTLVLFGENNGPNVTFAASEKFDGDCKGLSGYKSPLG